MTDGHEFDSGKTDPLEGPDEKKKRRKGIDYNTMASGPLLPGLRVLWISGSKEPCSLSLAAFVRGSRLFSPPPPHPQGACDCLQEQRPVSSNTCSTEGVKPRAPAGFGLLPNLETSNGGKPRSVSEVTWCHVVHASGLDYTGS